MQANKNPSIAAKPPENEYLVMKFDDITASLKKPKPEKPGPTDSSRPTVLNSNIFQEISNKPSDADQSKISKTESGDVSEITKAVRNTWSFCSRNKCYCCLISLLLIVITIASACVGIYLTTISTEDNVLVFDFYDMASPRPSSDDSIDTIFTTDSPTDKQPETTQQTTTTTSMAFPDTTLSAARSTTESTNGITTESTTGVTTASPKPPKPPNLNPFFDVNPETIRPIMYNLSLDLTPFSPTNAELESQKFIKYTGQLNVTVTIEKPNLRSITVNVDQHFVNPTKSESKNSWSQTVIQHSKTGQKLTFGNVHQSWGKDTQLTFNLNDDHQLAFKDQYDIFFPSFTVKNHQGKRNGGVRYGIEDGGKESSFVTWTDFKLRGARSVFPCFDHPGLRASFRLQLKHDPQLTAVSSQAIERQLEIDASSTLSIFLPTPPISTYSLSFSLTNIKPDRKINPKVEEIGKSALVFPSSTVAVDHPEWTLRYANEMIGQMVRIAKVAKQWLGHSVTVKDWSQICLQEGFAKLLSKLLFQMQNNAYKPNSKTPLKETILGIIEDTRSTALAYRGSVISREISDETKLEDKCHSKALLIFNMLMFNDLTSDIRTGHEDKVESFVINILEGLQLPGLDGSVDLLDWKKAVRFHNQHSSDGTEFDGVFDSYFNETVAGYPLISAHVSSSHLLLTQEPELNPLNPDKDTKGFVHRRVSVGRAPFFAVPLDVKFFTAQNRVLEMKFVWNNVPNKPGSTISPTITLAHGQSYQSEFALPSIHGDVAFFLIDPDGLTLSRNLYDVQNYRTIYDHCFDEETGHSKTDSCQLETRQIKFLTEDFCYGLLRNKFPLFTDPIPSVAHDKEENWKKLLQKVSQLSTPSTKKKNESPFFPKVCACCLKREEASEYGLCRKAKANVCSKIHLLNDLGWN